MRDLPHNRVGHGHIGRAIGPGGRQHQRLVAGIEHGAHADVQGLHARSCDDDLRPGVQFHVVQLAILPGDGAAQRRQPGIFGVERVAIGQGVDGGALDEVRRGQVRFAKIQPQHALHGHGDFGQLADAGVRNALDGTCDVGHSGASASPVYSVFR